MGGFMLEAVVCICGVLVLGGITKLCCTDKRYSEEYYNYLRNNKKTPERLNDVDYDYYRFL
jgi:hypothetical protein